MSKHDAMAALRDQVEVALAHASFWRCLADSAGAARYVPEPAASEATTATWLRHMPGVGFTADELALVDARLAKVLEAKHRANRSTPGIPAQSRNLVNANILRYSLDLWRGQLLTLPPCAFERLHSLTASTHVGSEHLFLFEIAAPSFEYLTRLIMNFDNCIIGHIEQDVPYVRHVQLAQYALYTPWMTQHYPQWEQQLALVKTLDMANTPVRRLIFPLDCERPVGDGGYDCSHITFE